MLAKRIIPCLDVKAGRVVKGVNFVGLKDAGDPVELAQRYNAEGADELVFLDITATHEDRQILLDVVQRTAEQVFIPLTVGGGIRDLTTIATLLRAGADKISLNSAAVRQPDLVNQSAARFGSQCIVVAIDARKRADRSGWDVFVRGGQGKYGFGCHCLGRGSSATGRRRAFSYQYGCRWHPSGLRCGIDPNDRRSGRGARHCLRWGGELPAHRRCPHKGES